MTAPALISLFFLWCPIQTRRPGIKIEITQSGKKTRRPFRNGQHASNFQEVCWVMTDLTRLRRLQRRWLGGLVDVASINLRIVLRSKREYSAKFGVRSIFSWNFAVAAAVLRISSSAECMEPLTSREVFHAYRSAGLVSHCDLGTVYLPKSGKVPKSHSPPSPNKDSTFTGLQFTSHRGLDISTS